MNTFNDMWLQSTAKQKKEWAILMDSSVSSMCQLAYGNRSPSKNWAELFSFKLEDGSTKESLFPDVFSKPKKVA